jgi:predicted amidophosphoribosyltransferase
VLRSAILTYKERGAHRLAAPLGDHLARAIALAVRRAGLPVGTPIVIIPVPTTAAAVRDRHGDHMMRLGRRSVRALGRAGWPAALAKPLSARPKADSSHLGAHERAAAAAQAFRARPAHVRRVAEAARAGAVVIAVDDVLTTGSTMAALARVLHDAGAPVHGAATLAATRLRFVRVTPWKEAPDAVEPPPTRTFRPDRNPARRVGDSR